MKSIKESIEESGEESIEASDTKKIKQVSCPQCGKQVPWAEESKYRPFCSKRCQMIDFGDWATEKNAIPAEEPPDDWENFEE